AIEPATARTPPPSWRDATRVASEGVRASNSASSSAHSSGRPGPSADGPAVCWTRHAAAANAAATRADVRSRARQKSSRSASPVTRPVLTAASIAPEWLCAPAGALESSKSSRTVFMAQCSWLSVHGSEQEVALGHGQLLSRLRLDDLTVDADRERLAVHVNRGQGVILGEARLRQARDIFRRDQWPLARPAVAEAGLDRGGRHEMHAEAGRHR